MSDKRVSHFDVVVVGAGPAGARAARDLARMGFGVLMLEDHREVGTPCHCSGLVTPRTLTVADVGLDLVKNSLRGATFQTRDGRTLQLTGRAERAVAIDRMGLDRRLVRQAVEAGAGLRLNARFARFEIEGSTKRGRGAVRIHVDESGRRYELTADLLVGADGALSRVASQLRGGRRDQLVRAVGGEAVYGGNELDDHVQIFLDEAAAPGWFGWTIPLGPGRARIGTGTSNGLRPVESLTLLRDAFPAHFAGSRLISRQAGSIPLWQPTSMVADRVILVGDAARQVKPASGGGILTGLVSAEVAAYEAARALDQGDLSVKRLSAYSRAWGRRVGRELKRQHDMRRALSRLDDLKFNKLLKTLTAPEVRALLEVSGDIDFPSRLVWRLLFNHPSIVLENLVAPQFPFAWLLPRQTEPAAF